MFCKALQALSIGLKSFIPTTPETVRLDEEKKLALSFYES